MKKGSVKSEKQFNRLTNEHKIEYLHKLTKRANVRLKLLDNNKISNDVVQQTKDILKDTGREKGTFYEGKKYKSEAEIKNVFNLVSNFLNNSLSTLKGVKDTIKEKVEKKKIDFSDITKMSDKELIYLSQAEGKKGNRKLKKLEDNNCTIHAYQQARYINASEGREKNRFYTGTKFGTRKELEIHVKNVMKFNSYKSSTLKGYKEIQNTKLNIFRDKGINIKNDNESEKEFLDFISSEQFKQFKKYMDSEQMMEDFVEARNNGISVEQINQAYEDYQNSKITYDVVQERLGNRPWLK